MKPTTLARRFLMPGAIVSLLAWIRYRALVSPRAEMEMTPNLKLGRRTKIGSFCKVKASDGVLRIGSRVDIGTGTFISAGAGGISIGDFTLVGPNVCIIGNDYRHDRLDLPIVKQGKVSKGIEIGEDVWIGAGAVVLDGSVIGDRAIVAAGSVVQGEIPEEVVVMGTPARAVRRRGREPDRAAG